MTNEMLELADQIKAYFDDGPPSTGGHSDAAGANAFELLELAEAALRAQSDVRAPAPQGEPVAWRIRLRESPYQWEFYREKPVDDASNLYEVEPLYAAPPPPAALADVLENVRVSIGKIADGRRGDGVPPELYRACHALTHMTKDSRS
jgi:hypothetical protein